VFALLIPDLWVSYSVEWDSFEVCHFAGSDPLDHRDCSEFFRSLRPFWLLIGIGWLWYMFRFVTFWLAHRDDGPDRGAN